MCVCVCVRVGGNFHCGHDVEKAGVGCGAVFQIRPLGESLQRGYSWAEPVAGTCSSEGLV